MAKVYKVWIDIEEYDDEEESGELDDIATIDIGYSGTFDTIEEARAFAKQLNEHRHESGCE